MKISGSLFVVTAVLLSACDQSVQTAPVEAEFDPPEEAIGERLFLETRFSQFFAQQAGQDVNASLESGDPILSNTLTTGTPLPGAFAGQSSNCASCHLVDQQLEQEGGGMRTYADFARRPPLPTREDGRIFAVRNSQSLVGISRPQTESGFFHFDGEFATLETLVDDTLTGRMLGWLPGERDLAIAHIARVIRQDNGSGELAEEMGGAYSTILAGRASSKAFVLPPEYRLDVENADDQMILAAVSRLIAAYIRGLQFLTDEEGVYNGSAYDLFLRANGLPVAPATGETPLDYARRLKDLLPDDPVYVDEGKMTHHVQNLQFGESEYAGLKVFLAESNGAESGDSSGIGNCLACHTPPEFTDFAFHNTGVSQQEYDLIHGSGAFAGLAVPGLATRNETPDSYLPAHHGRPQASEVFRSIPVAQNPERVDLGVWNIFANPDFPASQSGLKSLLCAIPVEAGANADCDESKALALSLAAFRTPSLRDLGHSQPYTHAGLFSDFESMVDFYRQAGEKARSGKLRNADPRLLSIMLDDDDVQNLSAFLEALNEDYE